jgi:cell division initiation protein
MEGMTPIDVLEQPFKRALRGYAVASVRSFLQLCAERIEQLTRENQQVHADLTRARRQLADFEERETTLKQAMITAQRAIEDIRQQADREADIIVNDAKVRADRILFDAHRAEVRVEQDIEELKRQRLRLTEELRSVLETHRKLLQTYGQESNVKLLEQVRAPPPPNFLRVTS